MVRYVMCTHSGRLLNYVLPLFVDVKLADVARSLSHTCRFFGHIDQFYSVAQHSVLVSRHCDPVDALAGLLHDAAEAYVGDLVAPLKRMPQLAGYRQIEGRVHYAICAKFGVPRAHPPSVTLSDQRVYMAELRDLRGGISGGMVYDVPPIAERIVPVGPAEAMAFFLDRFAEIWQGVPRDF